MIRAGYYSRGRIYSVAIGDAGTLERVVAYIGYSLLGGLPFLDRPKRKKSGSD